MRILLTGGTGMIGRALCRRWQSQGHDLIVWSRRPQQVPALCSGARGVAKLREIESDEAIDAVVNFAGAPIADWPWTAARREILWQSRVDLTRELVSWLGQQRQVPSTLLSGSAVGWYGEGGDRQLDETSPAGKEDFASRLCAAWEHEGERAGEFGMRVVLLRTAPVLAPKKGMLARLVPQFSLGLGGRLGSGQQWMPWIHLDDQVGLIEFLLQREECAGVFNACSPDPVRNAAFTQALARTLRRPAILPAPSWVLKLALGEMSTLLLGSQRINPRRTLDAGYRFYHPKLEPALHNLLLD
jgi:uncharacterized protein (TIGR01777 family)